MKIFFAFQAIEGADMDDCLKRPNYIILKKCQSIRGGLVHADPLRHARVLLLGHIPFHRLI
jgi:hypothetical protein